MTRSIITYFGALAPRGCGTALLIAVATSLAACNEQTEIAEPAPRPVRTVTLEKSEAGAPVSFTGRIEALDEAALGFRISGRMIERAVNVGDQVKPGQLLGRLEPANEMNACGGKGQSRGRAKPSSFRSPIISSGSRRCWAKAGRPAPISIRPSAK